jgi:hypothetical protein
MTIGWLGRIAALVYGGIRASRRLEYDDVATRWAT